MGDIWAVEPISQREFSRLPFSAFRLAEPLLADWPGKARDACSLNQQEYRPVGWLNPATAITANELGAPVGQALRVAMLRQREAAS